MQIDIFALIRYPASKAALSLAGSTVAPITAYILHMVPTTASTPRRSCTPARFISAISGMGEKRS